MLVPPWQYLALCTLSALVFPACSEKLDRPKAAAIIQQHLGLVTPKTETVDFVVKDNGDYYGAYDRMKPYQDKGLLTCRIESGFFPIAVAEFTVEGKKYVVGDEQTKQLGNVYKKKSVMTVRTNDLVFGEVTGMVEDPGGVDVLVDYTLLRSNPTPFFDYARRQVTESASIRLKRYDDGWRVQ